VDKRGFTLIEMMIAIVLLGIGLLAIAGMQVSSIRGNFFSHYLTQASYVAQDGLEVLDHIAYDNNKLNAGTYNDGQVTLSGIVFSRTYGVSINGNLKTITYRVTWYDGMNREITFSTIRSQ